MKHTYIQPQSSVIRFAVEDNILTATSFGIGVQSDETRNGSDICSEQKSWNSNNLWKGMDEE